MFSTIKMKTFNLIWNQSLGITFATTYLTYKMT